MALPARLERSAKMKTSQARWLAVIGLALQGALVVGYALAAVRIINMMAALGGHQEVAAKAAHITGAVASALQAMVFVQRIALVGLVPMAVALVVGRLRERWAFRWSIACMVAWVFLVGVGTIIGITGLVLLYRHRKEFGRNKEVPNL